jgi:hypothetical protein
LAWQARAWPGWPVASRVCPAPLSASASPSRLPISRFRASAYLGSLLFAADDLVLCLFCGPSRAAVIAASGRLGIPCERLMEPIWLGNNTAQKGTRK